MKRLLTYLRPHKFTMCIVTFLVVILTVLGLYKPLVIGDAIDFVVDKGQVDFASLGNILVRMGICIAVTAVAQWLMNTCNNHITYHVVQDIREDAFRKIQSLPLKDLDRMPVGDMVSRVVADVDTFADGLLMGFTQFFTGVMTILGTLIFMLVTNVPIALVVICITPVSFVVAKFISTKTYAMFKVQSETRAEQTSLIEEVIGNQKVVKMFSQEDNMMEKFTDINDRLERSSLRAIFYSSLTNPCTRFVNALVYAGVGVFGAMLAIKGGISVGRLSCFLSYANQYTKPFHGRRSGAAEGKGRSGLGECGPFLRS